MGMVHRKSPPVGGTFSLRKILILAENDGGAGEREGRGGDGDSNEVIGAGGGVLLVIGLGGVPGGGVDDDGGIVPNYFRLFTHSICLYGSIRFNFKCALFFAVAGLNGYILLRNNLGIDIKRGLPITLIAQQDIAIGADSASKGIVFNGCIQRAIAAVNEADRGCKCTPLTRITAAGEGAVLHGDSLFAICFVIEVYGNLATVECAVINDNRTVRIRVEGSCLGEKVAVCYSDVIDTGSTADVYTLQINGGFSITIGEFDIHCMVCMPLAPNAEVIKVGGCDGDILVEINTIIFVLYTSSAVKLKGVNFEVTFAIGNISAVANNGNIIRNMSVCHFADIGTRAAGDGDITIISHISGL